LPLRKHKAAVEEATQIVRYAALFKAEFFSDLPNVVRPGPEKSHNGKPSWVCKRPEELSVKSKIQVASLFRDMMAFRYDTVNISNDSGFCRV
jgi:hypothetical protein